MFNEIIEIGKATISTDENGDQYKTYAYRTLFAEIRSVSQSEFYAASQSGFKPVYKAVIADYYDEDQDDVVRYGGALYHIVRKYRDGVNLELTLERKTEATSNA